jgi:5-methylcytosine-specific restriction endonuclease McrA
MRIITCIKCGSDEIHVAKQLCQNCYWIEFRRKNRDKVRRRAKEWRIKNRKRYLKSSRLYWKKDYVRNRDNFRKGLSRYGRGFANNAALIEIVADHRCMICKKDDSAGIFNVHHLIPFALSRNNELWNLEYLCRECHDKREKYFRQIAERWDITIPTVRNLKRLT